MRRGHRPRNNYPEGYAEHNVEMDWRKERDASAMSGLMYEDDPNHDPDLAREVAINQTLHEQIKKTVARAELAEHALVGMISATKRARLYTALWSGAGFFIGYITRLIFA